LDRLCKAMRGRFELVAITNDIYQAAPARIDAVMDADPGTPEGE
jgi:hypothetical protein